MLFSTDSAISRRNGWLGLMFAVTPLLAAEAPRPEPAVVEPFIPIARGVEAGQVTIGSPEFVGVKDGHLFRNGQRLRLWGINIVQEYDTRFTKEEQLRILDRIQAVGFNALRPHLYDIYLVPDGDAGCTVSTYIKGDNSAMDKVDHFLAAAAERGLSLFMTFDRRRRAITPETWKLVPGDDGKDEVEWKKTVAELNTTHPHPATWIEQVWPLDERLEKIYTLWVKNLLAHTNLYTGKTYAEDPAIAMWEISNESSFIPMAMDGSSAAYTGYFAKQTQKRWNQFLRDHYQTTDRLKVAWRTLEKGESLEEGTITVSPVPVPVLEKPSQDDGKYPYRRIRDLTTFFVNQYIEANNRIRAVIRAAAPKGVGANVVPIGYDTHYQPNLLDMYGAAGGDVSIAGLYSWVRTYDTADPTYPWTSALAQPPALYGMDLGRIAGKPTVTYEVNIHRPAPYRAEFPFVIAAYDSARNWDGAFWYYWMDGNDKVAKTYEELNAGDQTYASTGDAWAGVGTYHDPIMVAAIKVAGTIFKTGALRADEHPARIVVGPEELIWSNAKIGPWLNVVRAAMRDGGAEIAFDPQDAPRPPNLTIPPATTKTSRLGPDVRFDHVKRQMICDAEKVKLFVGWPDSTTVSFGDGISINGLKVGQFIAFAMVTEDSQPIGRSERILLTALSTGENKGFKYDPKATTKTGWEGMLAGVVASGEGPVQVVWPKVTVALGNRKGNCTWFNVFPEAIGQEPVNGELVFDGSRPAAWAEVKFPTAPR